MSEVTRLPGNKYPGGVPLSEQLSRCQTKAHTALSGAWAPGPPMQRGSGQAWSAQSPGVKPEVPPFAEREKNLKSALLSKTLKCAYPGLAVPQEAVLPKRHVWHDSTAQKRSREQRQGCELSEWLPLAHQPFSVSHIPASASPPDFKAVRPGWLTLSPGVHTVRCCACTRRRRRRRRTAAAIGGAGWQCRLQRVSCSALVLHRSSAGRQRENDRYPHLAKDAETEGKTGPLYQMFLDSHRF